MYLQDKYEIYFKAVLGVDLALSPVDTERIVWLIHAWKIIGI